MRNRLTPQAPLFNLNRPLGSAWQWTVTYRVASSGYVTECHVMAHRIEGTDHLHGSAECAVALGDDLREVIECLATESMLAACTPTLDGSTPSRRIVFTSHF